MTPPLAADTARIEDDEQAQLARVDLRFHDEFGHKDRTWASSVTEAYLQAMDAVHADFHPQAVAA
jgi:hypothetical protein